MIFGNDDLYCKKSGPDFENMSSYFENNGRNY